MTRPIYTPSRTDSPRARRRTPVAQRPGLRVRVGWRWVSGGLALAIGVGLGVVFSNPIFYVTQVEVGGLRTVPAEEVFADTAIAGYHIFWIDPAVVAERVAASPSIESAEVAVLWPARVVIYVHEREPALVWEQGGRSYWVDVNGNLMLQRSGAPNLVRVISEGDGLPYRCPGPGCPEGAVTIDPGVVLGAQHLRTLRSNIDVLYYDSVHGLSYHDGRGWRAYFGVGTNMDRKLIIYEALVANLLARGIRPSYIDVSNSDAPFYGIAGISEP